MNEKPSIVGDPRAPVVERNIFGGEDLSPTVLLVDMSSSISQTIVSTLRAVDGGTAFEIRELQRSAQGSIDKMAKAINDQIVTGLGAMQMSFIDGAPRVENIPSWRFYKDAQLPQWRPLIRRPQQRSARMRKHARIVRSRMTPNEDRKKAAQWARAKRLMAARGILSPNASKFWKDFF